MIEKKSIKDKQSLNIKKTHDEKDFFNKTKFYTNMKCTICIKILY